ncbi:MAG: hypothetical protein AAF125_08385, partial [Chloroflexota bacterium]
FVVNPLRLALAIGVFGLGMWGIIKTPRPDRDGLILATVTGLAWLYGMFSLSTAHIYVTMYALPLVLAAYIALIRPLAALPDSFQHVLAAGAVVVFGIGLGQVRGVQNAEMTEAAAYTEDFSRIRTALDEPGMVSYFGSGWPRGTCVINADICFAPGYYLGAGQLISLNLEVEPDLVILPFPYNIEPRFVEPGEDTQVTAALHPENTVAFAFEPTASQPRTAPPELAPTARFGSSLALGEWTIPDPLTMPPCGTITVESWWYADEQPADNLNMQVVMVGDDGGPLASANRPLTDIPTAIWETGRYTLDVRRLSVPCDATPGSYPLIMGVYNPDTLASLPATSPDGGDLGAQYYLTNLTVEAS